MRVWKFVCEYVYKFLCEYGYHGIMRVWIRQIHASMKKTQASLCTSLMRVLKLGEYGKFFHASLVSARFMRVWNFNSMRVWTMTCELHFEKLMRVCEFPCHASMDFRVYASMELRQASCEYQGGLWLASFKTCEYGSCFSFLRVWFHLHATF